MMLNVDKHVKRLAVAGIVLIWLVSVPLTCSIAWNSFSDGGAGYRPVPRASLQIKLGPGQTSEQTSERVEQVLRSLNYVKQPPHAAGLGVPGEWTYERGDFEVRYALLNDECSQVAVWLDFYAFRGALFDRAGIAEYERLGAALASAGLTPSVEVDKVCGRYGVQTPGLYNAQHPNARDRTPQENLHWASTLLSYVLIFFVPGFWIALVIFSRLHTSIAVKRLSFIIATSVLLAPAPFPVIMFGPIFLAPMPLLLPFAFGSTELLELLAYSFGCTLILASILSLLIRGHKRTPDAPEAAL